MITLTRAKFLSEDRTFKPNPNVVALGKGNYYKSEYFLMYDGDAERIIIQQGQDILGYISEIFRRMMYACLNDSTEITSVMQLCTALNDIWGNDRLFRAFKFLIDCKVLKLAGDDVKFNYDTMCQVLEIEGGEIVFAYLRVIIGELTYMHKRMLPLIQQTLNL